MQILGVCEEVGELEPIIRNFRNIFSLEGPSARLTGLPDQPPKVHHQWRNNTKYPVKRVTFNPVAAEGHGG
jgi:hypothetical protein